MPNLKTLARNERVLLVLETLMNNRILINAWSLINAFTAQVHQCDLPQILRITITRPKAKKKKKSKKLKNPYDVHFVHTFKNSLKQRTITTKLLSEGLGIESCSLRIAHGAPPPQKSCGDTQILVQSILLTDVIFNSSF